MRSLKRALMAPILSGVALAVVAAGAAVYLVARASLRGQFDQALLDRARTLGALVTDDEGVLEFEYDHPPMEADLGTLVRITSGDGSVLVQSPDWPPQAGIAAPPPGGRPVLVAIALADGPARGAAITTYASRETGAGVDGPVPRSERIVTVEVIGRAGAVRRAESAVLTALAVGGCCAVAGASIAIAFGVRRGLAPVRDLGAAVDRLDAASLTLPSLPHDWPRELAPIVQAVTSLLDRLGAAIQRERRFTDAAAHELRTPIAELKTMTDVADRWPEAPRLRRAVQDAGVVVRQMEGLLAGLLAAARGEAAFEGDEVESVPLLPLARTLWEELRPHADPGIDCTFEGDDRAAWAAPRGLVVSIVRNLLDNAAEYTPQGGAVRVGVFARDGEARLEVESGPVALDSGQVQRLFEPFWRADVARSGARHRDLGLAIVDTLARSIHLHCTAARTRDATLRITVGPSSDV